MSEQDLKDICKLKSVEYLSHKENTEDGTIEIKMTVTQKFSYQELEFFIKQIEIIREGKVPIWV